MNAQDHCGEVPCWSGVWFEIEGHGYMEISDNDERHHKPPDGWKLESVNINILNSSQIFRYVPALVRVADPPQGDPVSKLMMLTTFAGATIAVPIIRAIAVVQGAA